MMQLITTRINRKIVRATLNVMRRSAATNARLDALTTSSTPYLGLLFGSCGIAIGVSSIAVALADKDETTTRTIGTNSPTVPKSLIGLKRTQCLFWKEPFHVEDAYDVLGVLGEGAYGMVYKAIRKRDGVVLALKAIGREYMCADDFEREKHALEVLSKDGGNKHICRLYGMHEDETSYYLALELIDGGELFEHLIQNGTYSEHDAAKFIKQAANALRYMHSRQLIHADLKPENLMMSSRDSNDASIKVIDFGCTISTEDKIPSKSGHSVGTIFYLPPEMLKTNNCTKAVDMWSIGIILYILLTGVHPFDPFLTATDEEMAKIIKGIDNSYLEKHVFSADRISGLSPSCVHLMRQLLEPVPELRMTSEELQRHPWFQSASQKPMDGIDIKLRRFWQKRFRAAVIAKYAEATTHPCTLLNGEKRATHYATLSEKTLKDMFNLLDTDNNGVLDIDEIRQFLLEMGIVEESIKDIMKAVDLDGSGTIEFDEFHTIMRTTFDDGPDLNVEDQYNRFRLAMKNKFLIHEPEEMEGEEESHFQKRPREHPDCQEEMKTKPKLYHGSDGTNKLSNAELRRMFETIDLNGNGVLEINEMHTLLKDILGFDENEIVYMIDLINTDQTGAIKFDEFCRVMNQTNRQDDDSRNSVNSN